MAGVGGGREIAIQNFERVIELVGMDSELGNKCAIELEKEKSTKKSGCFIATAVYGSELAEEVTYLSRFRDEVLLTRPQGRIFVDLYYRISPPAAEWISKHNIVKVIVKSILIHPLIRIVRWFVK